MLTITRTCASSESKTRAKWLSLLIYAIPIFFFIVCYFFVIVSGEDIHQGANSAPNIIGDIKAAFQHNSRIGDMYAWSVINFFDYKFNFGFDTIFRLIDVVMGASILLIVTRLIIEHKPHLGLGDAVWFLFGFVMLFLTPHGRSLYAGFSVAHNYLISTLLALVFIYPFINYEGRHRMPNVAMVAIMWLLGILFGLSSTITPIAFLITYISIKVFCVRSNGLKLKSWEVSSLIGPIIGLFITYAGGGISSYINSVYVQDYDYISIAQILADPVSTLPKIMIHLIINFARIVLPLVIPLIILLVCYVVKFRKLPKINNLLSRNQSVKVIILLAFLFIHVLISSQIKFPLRIGLPAYVAGIVATGILSAAVLRKLGDKLFVMSGCVLLTLSLVILSIRFLFAIKYYKQATLILNNINNSSNNVVCVSQKSIRSIRLPIIYLAQEDMLADWAMPETIYGKTVEFCN